jgi:hypothetical protein
MTINEFCIEVKRQMVEQGIPEDTHIDYIDCIGINAISKLDVFICVNGFLCIE